MDFCNESVQGAVPILSPGKSARVAAAIAFSVARPQRDVIHAVAIANLTSLFVTFTKTDQQNTVRFERGRQFRE